MTLRRGDRFYDSVGELWEITDVRRKDVTAAHIINRGASGITAKVRRHALEGWKRA